MTHNTSTEFTPHVTVATVVEKNGKFLFVEEESSGQKVLNQPAGHLEPNESLIEAAIRETLEETGWHVSITGLLCIGLYTSPNNGVTYHRTTFIGQAEQHDQDAKLDDGIIQALWLAPDEVAKYPSRPRSPLVMEAVHQYLDQSAYPLSIVGDSRA